MTGKIYLICDAGHDELYKIGRTKNASQERLGELQTGNPNELFVVCEYETKYPSTLETMLHRHFASKNVLNEWFQLEDDDVLSFTEICKKYEKITDSLSENPFFRAK